MENPQAATTSEAPKKGTVVQYLSYLYFLRVSFMLWLWMPLFALLDYSIAGSFTRGIVALDYGWNFFLASFFVAINGWIALLSARIVCAYGGERFDCDPPPRWAVTANRDMSVFTFMAAQVPGLVLLGYVAYISHQENPDPALGYLQIIGWLLFGMFAALVCWILIAGIYYWMFWNIDPRHREAPSQDSPKAFVVPYGRLFQALQQREPSAFLLVLNELGKIPAKLGPGYRNPDRPFNPLHSGHALAFLTLGFILTVYGVFWDFTAPVFLELVHKTVTTIIVVVAVVWVLAAVIYHLLVLSKRPGGHKASLLNLGLMVLLFLPMLLVVSVPFSWRHDSAVMPVLASVSVLILFVLWGTSALAFFLDRFRVPVLTATIAAVFLQSSFSTADHSVELTAPDSWAAKLQDKSGPPLATPADLFQQFENEGPASHAGPRPVIIVTATGGGIHAAAWTSAVLAGLENKFAGTGHTGPGDQFHSGILLMSTVSGGSVGTTPWAAEYLKAEPFRKDAVAGLTKIAECSDLQAVAWGLIYADFMRVAYPWGHIPYGPELARYDRGWALQQAFVRNRDYPHCGTADTVGGTEETLGDLAWKKNNLPAFSFNTTVAETGDRFLSSNYVVPDQNDPKAEITPADSFLGVYHRDLPLSSAARMSANFPYVSPMPRVPVENSHFHFGDGGYYDNDGTATAIEFLKYALQNRPAGSPRVPVLLIEIRDTPALDASERPDDLKHQSQRKDWGTLGQATGPLVTFWNAGHTSVTKRNHRELFFLEGALSSQVEITHVVFGYENGSKEPQPLSWHLTRKQMTDICKALENVSSQADEVLRWSQGGVKGAPGKMMTPCDSGTQ